MRLPIFEDTGGNRNAINPEQVVSVVKIDANMTDINLVGGGLVRVKLSFDNVVARLVGTQELAPK
jgi:hypothetical protein